jgi:phosphoglycolate phosphatase-like HAD superfamily hydrolase
MFDIDGTLTQSMSIDDLFFAEALSETFGFGEISTDWASYRHATDSAIVHELVETRLNREVTAEEMQRVRRCFVRKVEEATQREPVREIPGAGEFLRLLSAEPGIGVSFATGGWSDSARAKMRSAGLDFDAFPFASADDALERESIMKISLERAEKHFNQEIQSVCYIGDGIWDARACTNLRLPFIGIAGGKKAELLRTAGAVAVFDDFGEPMQFIEQIMA